MHCKPESKYLEKASVYCILVKIFEFEVTDLNILKWKISVSVLSVIEFFKDRKYKHLMNQIKKVCTLFYLFIPQSQIISDVYR